MHYMKVHNFNLSASIDSLLFSRKVIDDHNFFQVLSYDKF